MALYGLPEADIAKIRDMAARCTEAELEAELDQARDALAAARIAHDSARIRLNLLIEACTGAPAVREAAE